MTTAAAQLSGVDPSVIQIGLWVVGALAFMQLLAAGVTVAAFFMKRVEKRKIVNEPLEIAGEVKVSSRGRRFSAELCDARHSTIDRKVEGLESYTKAEVGRIHDKIDLVERRQADALNAAMKEVSETMRTLPNEIIALLGTTGQLRDHNRE